MSLEPIWNYLRVNTVFKLSVHYSEAFMLYKTTLKYANQFIAWALNGGLYSDRNKWLIEMSLNDVHIISDEFLRARLRGVPETGFWEKKSCLGCVKKARQICVFFHMIDKFHTEWSETEEILTKSQNVAQQ